MRGDEPHDAATIDALIAEIDRAIALQLDAVLHHPEFQRLEATWCGIRTLVESVSVTSHQSVTVSDQREPEHVDVLISLLDVSKSVLADDIRYAGRLRDTAIFDKIYQKGYNTFGAIPFAVVVGDFEFCDTVEDISLLNDLASIFSTAFSVFAAAVDPEFFHVDHFRGLCSVVDMGRGTRLDLKARFLDQRPEWMVLRARKEARFLALTLPRMLMRRPYDYQRGLGASAVSCGERDRDDAVSFCYRESIEPDGANHLWGSAAYAFAVVASQCFIRTGWLADIHGVAVRGERAGMVWRRPFDEDMFETERRNFVFKPATDVLIPDLLEKELASLGFMTLTHRHGSPHAAFCSTPSMYGPADSEESDEKISALLQYTLCVSRFAHEIKRLGHHKVGKTSDVSQVKGYLDRYLGAFVLSNSDGSPDQKAQRPLRKYEVRVRPSPGKPGHFECDVLLQMHHDLEAVRIQLTTELSGASTGG